MAIQKINLLWAFYRCETEVTAHDNREPEAGRISSHASPKLGLSIRDSDYRGYLLTSWGR